MITIIQRFLQKHSKWVYISLLVVIIIPFVFTIGASPGIGSGKKFRAKDFFGVNLNSQKELENLQKETSLSLYLEGIDNVPMDQAMLTRATWLGVLQQLQIPNPTQEELNRFVRTRRAFFEGAEFSEQKYREFLKVMNTQAGFSEALAAKVLADDWRMQLAAMALMSAHFVTPEEVLLQERQLQTEWSIETATLMFKDFQPEIAYSEADLSAYFEAHSDRYQLPERVRVARVFFPKHYTSFAKPTANQIREFFEQNAEQFGTTADNLDYLKENQRAVVEAYKDSLARQAASKDAGDFAFQLYDHEDGNSPEKVQMLAREMGGEWEEIAAFSRDELPENSLPKAFWNQAFDLDATSFFSEPLVADEGAYVLIFLEKLPAETLRLEQVRDRVVKEYVAKERIQQFIQYAKDQREELSARLAKGQSFASAAKNLGFVVKSEKAFRISDLPKAISQESVNAFIALQKNELSEFIPMRPDLQLVYVVEKKVPEVDISSESSAKTAQELYQLTSNILIHQVIQELLATQLQK